MRMILVRHTFHPQTTKGTVYCDNVAAFAVVEQADRLAVGLEKVPGATAIPTGDYRVSQAFARSYAGVLPLLHDVPGFVDVYMAYGHPTAGCIDVVNADAFEWLRRKLKQEDEEHVISIVRVDQAYMKPIFRYLKTEWL